MPIEGTLSDQGPSKECQEGEKANKWIPIALTQNNISIDLYCSTRFSQTFASFIHHKYKLNTG